MAFLDWDQHLITGNQEIDAQHQKLVELLNQLHEAMLAGKAAAILGSIFDELVKYTDYHFKTEERLFGSQNYQEKTAHIEEHRKLVKQALDLQTQFRSGKSLMSFEVLNFLSGWITNHILKMDMTYKGII